MVYLHVNPRQLYPGLLGWVGLHLPLVVKIWSWQTQLHEWESWIVPRS